MSSRPRQRPLACAFAACAVCILILLINHPGGGGHDMDEIVRSEARAARVAGLVHGGFIAISVLLIACLSALSRILGTARREVTLGFVAFCVGAGALMISMTLDGLVVPTLARRYVSEPTGELLERLRTAFLLCDACIGILMPLGLLFEGAAMLCFSVLLARSGERLLGGYGIGAGLLLIGALLLLPGTNPHVLMGGIVLLCAWYLALAARLWSESELVTR